MIKKSYHLFTVILLLLISFSCKKSEISFKGLDGKQSAGQTTGSAKAVVTNVSIVNDQLIINGSDLDGVTTVRVTGPSSFDESFSIESKTTTNLVANGLKNIAFALNGVFSLIISDAHGAATFQVTFTLQDGAVTASKLHDMGAGIGQVLKYNGTNWVPSDLGGLTYAGNWNANTNSPDLLSGGSLGEYYIVTTAGTTDLAGGAGTNSWANGDWAVWNNVSARWEKIDNATNVQSFNGRSGPVNPQAGDYTWAQINKTTSDINDIANVDTTGASNGKVLKFDGTNWIVGDDLSGGGAGSVTSTEIQDNTIENADINATAAIDYSKLNIADSDLTIAKTNGLQTALNSKLNLSGGTMTGDITFNAGQTFDGVDVSTLPTSIAANAAAITGKLSTSGGTMTGDLTMGANNIVTTGLVDGVDVSALNTAVSGKENTITAGTTAQYYRGDKSWQTLDKTAVGLTNVDNTQQMPLSYLDTATTLGAGSASDSKVPSQLAIKTYVDAQVASSGSGDLLADGSIPMTAALDSSTFGVRFKDADTNYVTLRAHNAMAADYSLILPNSSGSNGQVLTTDGSGNLTWSAKTTDNDTTYTAGTGLNLSTTTFNVDVGTTANKIVQLNGSGELPAVSGANLTNLPNPTTSTTLTGFTTGADATVTNTDTVEVAIEKLQGQVDDNNTDIAANVTALSGKEPSLATGTTAQYYRGDKSWQTLNKGSVGLGNVLNVAQIPSSDLDTATTLGSSNTKVASQLAVKTYVDTVFSGGVSSLDELSDSKVGGTSSTSLGIGTNALSSMTSGFYNVAIGIGTIDALVSGGNNNIGVGGYVLTTLTGGDENIALGSSSQASATVANRNVGVGYSTLRYNKTGSDNITIGANAGEGSNGNSDNISENIFIGTEAGFGVRSGSTKNIAIGHSTGSTMTTGTDNILIGYDIELSVPTRSNQLNIGNTIYGNLINGNVGIGETNPTSKLHVEGSIQVSDGTNPYNPSSDSGLSYGMFHHSSVGLGFYSAGAGGDQGISFWTNNGSANESMRLTNFGRLGIGTTSPSYNLHVVGTAGKTTGTAWTAISDERLKTVGENYSHGLSEILKLNTVRFRYKDIPEMSLDSKDEHIGFIAQEVQEVIPEAVSLREDGYLELNVDPIHWASINAIQELDEKINENKKIFKLMSEGLVEKVSENSREIAQLKEENKAMKEVLCELKPNAQFCK